MSQTNFPSTNNLHARSIIYGRNLPLMDDVGRVMRDINERVAEQSLRQVFTKYTTTTKCDKTEDIVVEIDCYVFSVEELRDLLLRAREEGKRDAERWMRYDP